jgi:hypothetical protein
MAKATKQQLIDLYNTHKSKDAFIDAARIKYKIKADYSGQLYYKIKNGKFGVAPKQGASKPKEVVFNRSRPEESSGEDVGEGETESPQTITPENLTAETGEVNPEDEELKRSYAKMLKGLDPKESVLFTNADNDSISNVEFGSAQQRKQGIGRQTQQKTVRGPSGSVFTGGGKKTLSYNIGHAVGMSLKSVNNNLLWQERPLTEENTLMIDEISQDFNTRHIDPDGTFSEDPNADIWMMVLAGGVLPAIERIDLWPKKVEGVVEWCRETFGWFQKADRFAGQPRQNNNGQQQQPQEKQAQVTTPTETPQQQPQQVDLSKYSPGVQVWMNGIIGSGGKVDPAYISGNSIDYDFLNRRNVLRNIGSSFE